MRSILRSTAYNFLAQVIPTGVAVVTVPALLQRLGPERVGLLTIVWAIVGYFSILDLGLGFAVTRTVAEALAHDRRDDVPSLFWGALRTQVVLGIVGGAAFAALTPWLARLLRTDPGFAPELTGAFYLCAVALPFLLCSSTVVGLLHAAQRFDVAARIQVPLSAAQYLLPLVISVVTRDVRWVVTGILATRGVGLALTFRAATAQFPSIRRRVSIDRDMLWSQLRFGGWMTVSNVLSPAMVYLDRFVIGAVLSVARVAYYAVPMDALLKISAIPNSLSTVLFSVFSHSASQAEDRSTGILREGFRWLLLTLAVPTAVALVFAGDLLQLWLGPDFAREATLVSQILIVGIFANSLTRIPFVYVTSTGRSDLVAKAMAVQAPLQLGAAYGLVLAWGLPGAALAWSFRLVAELGIYVVLAERISGHAVARPLAREAARPLAVMGVVVALSIASRWLARGLAARLTVAGLVMLVGALLLYGTCLRPDERRRLWSLVRREA